MEAVRERMNQSRASQEWLALLSISLIFVSEMNHEKPLSEAINGLYKAFARYPLRKHVEGCPCCVHEPEKRALGSKLLRQLNSSDLGQYAFKAMTTWGDENDFRHFLPRMFELVVSSEGIGWDEEVVLGKLRLAKWGTWPEKEQAALRAYFRAGWQFLLSQENPHVEPDSWLCGIAIAGEDLLIYLNDWIQARQRHAYEHLNAFVEQHQPTYVKRHSLSNPFWPTAPRGVTQICDWFASEETRNELEKIYFENDSSEFASAISKSVNYLEQISKS
jgi:hypothetical protein